MARDDEKDQDGGPGKGLGKKLDRRDVLLGLSTVPALGLFGQAWRKQRQYEQVQKEAASADEAAPPTDVSEINLALLGSGAQGQVLLDSMLKIPGLRFRAVSSPLPTSGTPRTPWPVSRRACTCTARRRCRTPWRAPGAWCSPPGRAGSCSRSGTSGAATRATYAYDKLLQEAQILGCFTRLASAAGVLVILLFYLCNPPFVGYFYSIPTEGSYLIVNKNLVELAALAVILVTGSGRAAGLDRIIHGLLTKRDRPTEA